MEGYTNFLMIIKDNARNIENFFYKNTATTENDPLTLPNALPTADRAK